MSKDDTATMSNGFGVAVMDDLSTDTAPANQDTYHMYTLVGQNAASTNHHHKYADVTVFFSNTSPYSEHDTDKTRKNAWGRYVIIVDAWTGKRLKVLLPDFDYPEA